MKLTVVSNDEFIGFDITLIINKKNEIQVVDNQKEDYHDYIDGDTLVVEPMKISV